MVTVIYLFLNRGSIFYSQTAIVAKWIKKKNYAMFSLLLQE